jgi:predicted dehydrogenase
MPTWPFAAMEAGAHVFVEKPLATTVSDAEKVVDTATRLNRKLVVGYILRHHPSWTSMIAEARALGGPYVFRMNLNQQSSGAQWDIAQGADADDLAAGRLRRALRGCDVPGDRRAARARAGHRPAAVATRSRPTCTITASLQVVFEDGSVGWYEAGWGPMMSETAFFVKDIISPNGSVSITDADKAGSADIDGHTKVGGLWSTDPPATG